MPFPYVHAHNYTLALESNLMTLIVLWLPAWFPGATFKRASVACLKAGHDIKEIPFQIVKARMVIHVIRSTCNTLTNHKQATGDEVPCFVADSLNRMNGSENVTIETAIKEAACIALAGTRALNDYPCSMLMYLIVTSAGSETASLALVYISTS